MSSNGAMSTTVWQKSLKYEKWGGMRFIFCQVLALVKTLELLN